MWIDTFVLSVLRGPAHRLVPAGLTQISYTGPLSTRSINLPARSVEDGNRFLVVAGRPDRKRWWRAFRSPLAARLVRGGRHYEVTGTLLSGADRTGAISVYVTAHPASRRGVGPQTPVIAFERVSSAGVGGEDRVDQALPADPPIVEPRIGR